MSGDTLVVQPVVQAVTVTQSTVQMIEVSAPGPQGPPGASGYLSPYDAIGDLVVGTGPDTAIRLPVGTNGQVLMADSSVGTVGMKWTSTITAQTTFSAGLISSGGNWQVDSSGRVGIGGAPNTAYLINGSSGVAHPGNATSLYGFLSDAIYPSTTTGSAYAFYGRLRTAAASFTLANGNTFYAAAPILGASSAITTQNGLYVVNQGLTGVTNAYGVQIPATSGATTLNVGARIDTGTTCALWLGGDVAGTTIAGGISMGSSRDTQFFRVAAARFQIVNQLQIGTNPATTGTLGIPNASGISSRNAANSGDFTLIVGTGSDVVGVAGSGAFVVDSSGRIATAATPTADRMTSYSTHPGSATTLYGILNLQAFPATTTVQASTFYAQLRTVASAFTLTNGYAIQVANASIGATSTITNVYGLFVAATSGGGTTSISTRIDTGTTAALWLGGDAAGTTVAGGIAFGSGRDVTLYRSAASTLRTDNIFQVNAPTGTSQGFLFQQTDTTLVGSSVAGAQISYTFSPGSAVTGAVDTIALRIAASTASANIAAFSTRVFAANFAASDTSTVAINSLYGMRADANHAGSGTAGQAVSFDALVRSTGGGVVSTAIAFNANSPIISNSGTIATAVGVEVANMGATGITTAYGIDVGLQSGASSTNAAIVARGGTHANLWLNSDTASIAGGIAFGTARDVAVYRTGSGQLRVDQQLGVNITPTVLFHVSGAMSTDYAARIVNTSATRPSGLFVQTTNNSGTLTDSVVNISNTAQLLKIDHAGLLTLNATTFQVDSSGRVGAGQAANAAYMVAMTSTHPGSATSLYAAVAAVTYPATTTSSGFGFFARINTVAASFTMSAATAFYADAPQLGAGSTISTAYGVRIINQGNAGITTSYGLRIDAQSGSGTSSYSARIDTGTTAALWIGAETTSTTVAGGITFGSGQDVAIYRGGAAQLNVTGSIVATGSVQTGTNTVAGALFINGQSGASRTIHFLTAASTRWQMFATSTAESGSNVGSDFQIRALDDSGATLTNPLIITRSTGLISLHGKTQFDTAGRMGMIGTAAGASTIVLNQGTHPGTTTTLNGFYFQVTYPATTTSVAYNIYSQVRTAASAFTLSQAFTVAVDAPVIGAGSAITTQYGIYIWNQGITGVTNSYGLTIENTTGSATINVNTRLRGGTTANLWLDNDTASIAGGIAFGSGRDVGLFRNASDFLKTNVALGTSRVSAPADGSLAAGDLAIWYDSTNGASKLMVKAKQADGTVKTASLALA